LYGAVSLSSVSFSQLIVVATYTEGT
jgi:hypothetical protein